MAMVSTSAKSWALRPTTLGSLTEAMDAASDCFQKNFDALALVV